MIMISRLITSLCAVIALSGPAYTQEQVTIFAAASLRGALDVVVQEFDRPVVISYGGSGVIARQVAQGAPADLVILASAAWMDWLLEQSAVVPQSHRSLLTNTLVLIAPDSTPPLEVITADAVLDRLDAGRLAIGQTQSVPAGIYAREWMEATGLWASLQPRLAETENVRAALALVSRGEAPLGVVYRSDAQAAQNVQTLHDVDPKWHSPIVYPAAIVTGRDRPQVRAVLNFLYAASAQAIFLEHGFALPEAGK